MTKDFDQPERWTEFEQVLTKTAVDGEYRAAFLDDPKGVLRADGIEIPDEVEVQVVDGQSDDVVVPLPPFVGDKLDVDQLEAISGGLPRGIRHVLGTFALPFASFFDGLSSGDAP